MDSRWKENRKRGGTTHTIKSQNSCVEKQKKNHSFRNYDFLQFKLKKNA